MSKCIMCGKGGKIFGPALTEEGLCKYCDSNYVHELNQVGRILMESVKIVNNTKNVQTLISRMDLIVEKASRLVKYEKLNLPTVEPPPTQILNDFEVERDDFILNILNDDLTKTINKLKLNPTITHIDRSFQKIFEKFEDVKEHFKNEESIRNFQNKIRANYRELIIKTHLESGKKAEFKGQKKKAKESYEEVLYFIEN